MPAACCGPGEDGTDSFPFESIKCKQAIVDRPSGATMDLELQVPVVAAIGATTHAPQAQSHRLHSLQLSSRPAAAALVVAKPTMTHVGEDPLSPNASRLRPQTPRQCIQLAAVPATMSPVIGSPSQQQQLQQQQSPRFQGRVPCSGSFCQTPCSPTNSPTARRQKGQPNQGQLLFSRVVHAGPDQTSSPRERQGSVLNHKSKAGTATVEHERSPELRRGCSLSSPKTSPALEVEDPNPFLEPSEKPELPQQADNRLEPLTGSIDDSNTTCPPSPTVYYGTPNFTHRRLNCDDVQIRVSSSSLSSQLRADMPNLGHGSAGSLATTEMNINE